MLERWEGSARVARNDWATDGTLSYDPAVLRGNATSAFELFQRLLLRMNIGQLDDAIRGTLLGLIGATDDTPIEHVSDVALGDLLSFLSTHPLFQLR